MNDVRVMDFDLKRRLGAEFVGTAMLLAAVVGSGIMAETLAGDRAVALLCTTIPTAAMLVVLILMFGPISGGHFNPAVTLAFWLREQISARESGAYAVAQCAGAVAGVVLAHAMFEQPAFQASATARTGVGLWLSEAVATFALVAAILGTLRLAPNAVAYAVGLVIAAGYWFTASTSFANPAVTLARTLTDTFSGILGAHVPAFVAAQFAGAAAATTLFGWLLQNRSADRKRVRLGKGVDAAPTRAAHSPDPHGLVAPSDPA